MHNIYKNWKLCLLPLYALIIVFAVGFLHSYTVSDVEKEFMTPTFEDARGWDIYQIVNGTKVSANVQELFDSDGETFYLSKTMDKELEQDGYTIMELDGTSWQESVFLDDQLLYTVDPNVDNRIGHVVFPKEYKGLQGVGEYVRFTLPSGYGGKTLTIAVAANGPSDLRGLPMVRMSSENIQTVQQVSDTNRVAMPATVYMTVALILLGLFFYNWFHGQKSYSVLLLTISALLLALRELLNFEFYITTQFSIDFLPADLLIPLAFGFPMVYVCTQMKRWRKWYAPFIGIPLLISIACHLLARIQMFSCIAAYPYDALLYISLLALGVFAVLEWKDGNRVFRLFTPMFYACIGVIALMALWYVVTGQGNHTFVIILRSPILMMYEAQQRYGILLLMLAGVVSFILTVKTMTDTQNALSVMSIKNELMNENMESMLESSQEIAGIRHDMLHHLHAMQDLSHAGEMDRLTNYLEDLTRETETILPLRVCQNVILNALLTRAMQKAKLADIEMKIDVDVEDALSIHDNDLCTFVMNMLNNALEATARIPEKNRRIIEVTMHIRGQYLFLETINPYDGEIVLDKREEIIKSTKGEGHGYGMKAMVKVVHKYHSKLQILKENQRITIRTALLLPE